MITRTQIDSLHGFYTDEADMEAIQLLCDLAHYGQRSGCDLRDYEFWCMAEANKTDSCWIEIVHEWYYNG